MSHRYERDGGRYIESVLLVCLCCQCLVYALYMIFWADTVDYEQYIQQTRSTDITSTNAIECGGYVIAYIFLLKGLVLE